MKKQLKKLCVILLSCTCFAVTGCGASDSGAYDRGMEALEAGNLMLAQEEFRKAETNDDRVAEVRRGEGILAMALGNYDEALHFFDSALDHVTGSNKAFIQDVKLYKAETLVGKTDYAGATAICEELLDGSKASDASLLLGRIALEKGDLENAAEFFAASVSDTADYQKYLTIYDLYVGASMEADGAAYLEKALQLTPSNAEDFCSQGQLYYNLGETEQAKTSFARAIDLGNTDAVPMMGKLYLENGETQAARSMYESYLKEAVRPAIAYNGLALCDLADKNYDAALQNIGKGLAEEDAEVRQSLLFNEIAAYEYKLDFQSAKAKMQAFLQEYPENQEAQRENIFLQSR